MITASSWWMPTWRRRLLSPPMPDHQWWTQPLGLLEVSSLVSNNHRLYSPLCCLLCVCCGFCCCINLPHLAAVKTSCIQPLCALITASYAHKLWYMLKKQIKWVDIVDIYIPIGRRHNDGLAHYYRKSMEWSGESSPLGRLLMHHLSPNIYSSQNRQNGYIFTRDYCNSNGSSGSRCTQIVGYHYFDHHQPSRGSSVRLL